MSTKIRNFDENFHFPGTSDTLPLKVLQLSGILSPLPTLSTNVQVIKTPDDPALQRGAGIKLTLSNFPNLSYQFLSGSTYRTNEFRTSYLLYSFTPFISIQECSGNPTTRRASPWRASLNSRTTSREIGMRSEYLNLGILEKNVYISEVNLSVVNHSEANLPDSQFTTHDSRTKYRTSSIAISKTPLNLSYTNKQKFEGNHSSTMNLGALKFSSHGLNLAYDLTSLERKLFEEEYFRVPSGEGSFSYDSLAKRYYPDSHGDYEKKLIPVVSLTSDEFSIYKSFNFLNSLTLNPSQDFSIRFAITKRGEGPQISFWKRTYDAFEDRNRINLATRVSVVNHSVVNHSVASHSEVNLFELYANYVKEDWRDNKISGILGFGNQEILEVNFQHSPMDLSFSTHHTNRWQQFRGSPPFLMRASLTWEERANTIGIGLRGNALRGEPLSTLIQSSEAIQSNEATSRLRGKPLRGEPLTSHFLVQGEERKITEPPYPEIHFYGYSGEPTLTYELNDKRFETRIKLTNWLSNPQVPPSVRVIYPPGISTEWGIELMFFSQTRTNYTFSYQGIKTPDYPTDHSLNAELSINF